MSPECLNRLDCYFVCYFDILIRTSIEVLRPMCFGTSLGTAKIPNYISTGNRSPAFFEIDPYISELSHWIFLNLLPDVRQP